MISNLERALGDTIKERMRWERAWDKYQVVPAKKMNGEDLHHLPCLTPLLPDGWLDDLEGLAGMLPDRERMYELGDPRCIDMLSDFVRLCRNPNEPLWGGRLGPAVFAEKWGSLGFMDTFKEQQDAPDLRLPSMKGLKTPDEDNERPAQGDWLPVVNESFMGDSNEFNTKHTWGDTHDPIVWIGAHANNVRLVLELMHALRDGDDDAITGLIFNAEPTGLSSIHIASHIEIKVEVRFEEGYLPWQHARIAITRILGGNSIPLWRHWKVPHTPLEAIYGYLTSLKDSLVRESREPDASPALYLRRCQECDSPLVANNHKQLYCPPNRIGKGARSACRTRYQKRQARSKANA